MKTRIRKFFKAETVLIISAIAAIASTFFVVPSVHYISYIDFRVLALLFCLMAVVSGFQSIGVFSVLCEHFVAGTKNTRRLCFTLVMLCFFGAMFITNDVALIAFVPFTILVLTITEQTKHMIYIITLQTIAANLGSMLTPIGNPQNLYLYSFYKINAVEFFQITWGIVCISFLLLCGLCFFIKGENITVTFQSKSSITSRTKLVTYLILFLLCVATVFHLMHYLIVLGIVVAVLLLTDRRLFKKIDYSLLFTFVCFFIFVGNIGNIELIKSAIKVFIEKKEFFSSIVLSQLISNVPVAVLLSSFTHDFKALVLGTNIGGLGTLIASLASLISFKFYVKTTQAKPLKYLGVFTLINIVLLVILVLFSLLV